MIMRNVFFFLILFSLSVPGRGQELITVSGRVVSEDLSGPVPYASVSFQETGGKIITGAISDDQGMFIIQGFFRGTYLIKVSFVGYETSEKEIVIGELNRNFDVGKIVLKTSATELEEVLVEGQRSVISSGLETKNFNMEDYPAQAGGTVLETLKVLPGITVDQEGKIILRGSDKVIVLVDGKQSSLTGFGSQKGLDNIPASNIERIEIINNPSAKYDAGGMAGIVNIVYKKETGKGINAELGFSFGLGAITKARPDLPSDLGSYSPTPKYIPSLNMNFRKEKVNFFLQSEQFFQKKLPNNEFTTRKYEDGRKIVSQVPENRTQQHYILKAGFDFYLNTKNILTFSGIYDWEKHIDTAQVPFINLDSGDRYRYWAWNEKEITGFMNYSANFNHHFTEPGHELNINAQYTKGWEDESYSLNDSSEYRVGMDATHILATEHITQLSGDYTRPMGSGRLEAGLKTQWRFIPVDYTINPGALSIIYPGMGDWSEWGENMYSGYLNYIYEREVFAVEAGMRAEYTDVYYTINPENIYYMENDSYSYFKWFPNVRVSYRINPANILSVFFNRRIDRPGEPELRIFPKYDDPELLKVGNPYLRPQYSEAYEIAYRKKWKSGSVFLSGFYRIITDPFMRIYSVDTLNTQYDIVNKIYQNTGKANNRGLEILISQNFRKSWKFSAGMNYYRNILEEYSGTMLFPYSRPFYLDRTVDNTWDLKISNQLELPKQIQVQLTALYYAPKNIPQGKELARSSLDLGIRKKIFDSRGEVFLNVSDIFNDFGLRQEIEGDGFTVLYENYYETRELKAGLKYKF